jgi:predicted deacylase
MPRLPLTSIEDLPPHSSTWVTWCVDAGLAEPLQIDAYMCRGAQLQPLALITAGVHGDEYEGPAAIAALARLLDPHTLAGSVIAVPVVNPMAFTAAQRLSPDGGNLARTFPGIVGGTPTGQLAAWFFERVAKCASHIIDLHSGGIDYRFLPLVGFYGAPATGNPSFDAARHFGLEHLWQLPETPGVLSCEAWKLGITAIGAEYLGAAQLSPAGVTAYTNGVLSCLAEWGIARPSSSLEPSGHAFQGDWQLAAATGVFQARCTLGDSVQRGDCLAEITDARGSVLQRFTSATAAIVLGLRSKARIRENESGVLTGIPVT